MRTGGRASLSAVLRRVLGESEQVCYEIVISGFLICGFVIFLGPEAYWREIANPRIRGLRRDNVSGEKNNQHELHAIGD